MSKECIHFLGPLCICYLQEISFSSSTILQHSLRRHSEVHLCIYVIPLGVSVMRNISVGKKASYGGKLQSFGICYAVYISCFIRSLNLVSNNRKRFHLHRIFFDCKTIILYMHVPLERKAEDSTWRRTERNVVHKTKLCDSLTMM